MGCNCGGKPRKTIKYKVTFNDGTTGEYLTRAEAETERGKKGATRPVVAVTAP